MDKKISSSTKFQYFSTVSGEILNQFFRDNICENFRSTSDIAFLGGRWGCILVNFLVLGFGCGIGWFSLALPLLQSETSPLYTGPLTVENISWLGAIISVGAVIGNVVFGYIVTKIGSKNAGLLLGVPQLVWYAVDIAYSFWCAVNFKNFINHSIYFLNRFRGWFWFLAEMYHCFIFLDF